MTTSMFWHDSALLPFYRNFRGIKVLSCDTSASELPNTPLATHLICREPGQDVYSRMRKRMTTKAARLTQKAMTMKSVERTEPSQGRLATALPTSTRARKPKPCRTRALGVAVPSSLSLSAVTTRKIFQ
jgi:hypothetical protein